MAKKWEIYDLNGNRIEEEDDADGILQPNRILRVPMMMRDSMSPLQRSVADAKMARDAAKQRFGLDDALALHKPGQRFCTDQTARARVEQARAEGIREMCDAWQRKPNVNSETGVGSHELRGQQPGDQCTINGAPGHLNHRLECIPDKRQDAVPRVMDAAESQRIKDQAYREMVDDLTNAWRKPA
jgi:hypothetical protein